MLFALFAHLLSTHIVMSRFRLVGICQILALSMQKEILKKSPLFQGMTNYQMRKAILISERQAFKKGDLLVEQGTVGRSMYLILSGKVEIVRKIGSAEKSIAVLEAGEIFGEISYIAATNRTADVLALTPVEALRFDYQKLSKDLKFFPHIIAKLNFNISFILGRRLADLLENMAPRSEKKENPD